MATNIVKHITLSQNLYLTFGIKSLTAAKQRAARKASQVPTSHIVGRNLTAPW
jgi:hypothetical protein